MLNTKMMNMMQLCGTVAVIFAANLVAVEAAGNAAHKKVFQDAMNLRIGEKYNNIQLRDGFVKDTVEKILKGFLADDEYETPKAFWNDSILPTSTWFDDRIKEATIEGMQNPMAEPEMVEYTCVNSNNDRYSDICEGAGDKAYNLTWSEEDKSWKCYACLCTRFCVDCDKRKINKGFNTSSRDVLGWIPQDDNQSWKCKECATITYTCFRFRCEAQLTIHGKTNGQKDDWLRYPRTSKSGRDKWECPKCQPEPVKYSCMNNSCNNVEIKRQTTLTIYYPKAWTPFQDRTLWACPSCYKNMTMKTSCGSCKAVGVGFMCNGRIYLPEGWKDRRSDINSGDPDATSVPWECSACHQKNVKEPEHHLIYRDYPLKRK